MDSSSYSSMLERTRVPQPSLQKFAVISIFEKLRSAPTYLNVDSNPGRDAISHCLQSSSPAVIDQSVREICRFVKDGKLDISRGFLELQSALEGCHPRFVDVFVKSIGYLVRFGFQKDISSFRFSSPEYHPFVKVFSCRTEVQSELNRQVLLFIVQNKQFGLVEVCSFLKPFLNFVIIKTPFSISLCTFLRGLVASIASVCCSFNLDAIPVIKLLMGCLSYIPCKSEEEFRNIVCLMGYLFDAYVVVLRYLVEIKLHVHEVQLCGVELLEVILSICTKFEYPFVLAYSVEVSKQFIYVQKELGLSCLPELSSLMLSLFMTLIQSEIEHEQLSILKLLLFFTKWRNENGNDAGIAAHDFSEELLFIFPVINLVSSPSKPVKQAAINLLSITEKHLTRLSVIPLKETKLKKTLQSTSRPKDIAFRLLQHLWFQEQPSTSTSFLLSFCFDDGNNVNNISDVPKTWTYLLKEYCLQLVEKKKSSLPISPPQENFLNEMPLLLGTIASILVMHPGLVDSAVDYLSISSIMDPKLGVSLLLTILFYNHLHSGVKDINLNRISQKLLGLLPSLASHPTMVPLVVQAIMPMLQDVGKPVLYSSALRLLCKTWETNSRAFGSLQKVLQPKHFDGLISDRTIYISMAASVRDVCRKDADRGVDLILSVSACIESPDSTIQALGFQSLSYLCEADVIDFYTAWDVIAKHVVGYFMNPLIAYSTCLLLKWGAMDAEAYPEAASQVLQILWKIGSTRQYGPQWAKARASSFDALTCYEVEPINKSIPDFKRKNIELFTTETDPEVLSAIEAFEVKFISYEHMTRKRFVREKRRLRSKIEKLLNVSPQAIFASGNVSGARELPGAALFCLPLLPIDATVQGLQDVHAKYENMLVEIATSLQLSRNILIALISLQSWRTFIQGWMRALIKHIDSKGPSNVLDKTSIVADKILKSMKRVAEESVPRSAENVALALGAFCEALPPSTHLVKAAASRFLLDWLFQQEHEHRQWSAAISLGLISSGLHVTDIKQKLQNVDALIEVASKSRSILVRGACGVGLGISCQNLLVNIDASSNAHLHGENYRLQEVNLLGRSLRALSEMLSQYAPSACQILESLHVDIFHGAEADSCVAPEQFVNNESSKEEIWGIAGLVLGLGSCIGAVYRAGAFAAVEKIKTLILSWIPLTHSQDCSAFDNSDFALSVGSCLTLPVVAAFCLRVELMDIGELDQIINALKEFLSELLSAKKSSSLHQSLLMASCAGSGNLLAFILSDGVHTLHVGIVKEFLELWRRCYIDPHPPLVCLGGMLGVINALGAYAGTSMHHFRSNTLSTSYELKGSTHVMGPLLSNLELEPQLTSLVQEMFLLAQNYKDRQLQHYASWTISLLRQQLRSQESQNIVDLSSSDAASQRSGSQTIARDTVVMELSLWVMHLKNTVAGSSFHVNTVAAVIQCLSKAPRLPILDWGGIIRRCMIHDNKIVDIARERNLREVCVEFSFAQASHFDSLLSFIDELSELSRFGRLELNLQAYILLHLADLVKVFSGSRVDKLFSDVAIFLSSLASNNAYNREHKIFLNVSTWKGLYSCLDDPSIDFHQHIERCIVYLFQLLPSVHHSIDNHVMAQGHWAEEWSAAIRCLTKAPKDWVLDILKVTEHNLLEGDDESVETLKKIQAMARLFRVGFLKGVEIASLKTCLLNCRSHVIWSAQVEIVAALQHSEGSLRRQWLLDAVQICCVTKFPTTALQFLGLLCGSWCKYMPMLIVDPLTLLRDLPVTISSLLSESSWLAVAETVTSCLWVSTERIYDWATKIVDGNIHVYGGDSEEPIDNSENDMSLFLLRVLHDTCFSLKDHLSSDKQLSLANMVFPESS